MRPQEISCAELPKSARRQVPWEAKWLTGQKKAPFSTEHDLFKAVMAYAVACLGRHLMHVLMCLV